MMSQRDDKEEDEFSNWAKTVLGLKKARDGSIKYIKSEFETFLGELNVIDRKHSSNDREHFKELLIKVAVNAKVNKNHFNKRNKTKFEWLLNSNNCITCEEIFKKQNSIMENKSWCICDKWLQSSTKKQVVPSSYWWILAKMYMIKSKVINAVGPEEVEPLAIFNLIKFCKLFDSNLRSDVDNIVQLRHSLMHSANNRLTEKEMNDNFGLIKTFLQQVADNPTETIDDVKKLETSTLLLYDESGEFSEKIKEALQLQGESLTADLKSPDGIRGATITSLTALNMTIKRQELKLEESEKKHNLKYEELMKQKEVQIHNLERDLQYEIEKNKAYEVNLKEFKENITTLSQECEQRKTELCSLDEKMEKVISDLQQEKSKQDDEICSLKSTMEKKISDLEKDNSKQDSVISSLKSTIKGEIDDLKQEKSKHDKEILSLKITMEKEISDMKQDKSKQDDEIYSLESKVLQTEENINDLKQDKSKQDEEISSLKSKLEKDINDMKEEKSKQDGVISYLMRTMDDLKEKYRKQDGGISSLKNTLSTYQVQPAEDYNMPLDRRSDV